MSSKAEPAQAPAKTSPIESGQGQGQVQQQQQQPQQFTPQPHHPNYHEGAVIYQQPYAPVHHQQMHQWNQPPTGTVHYVQYQHPHQQQEVTGYPEKVHAYNHFGTVHFTQSLDNGVPPFVPQQFIPGTQWYQPPPPPHGHFVPTYATNFNVATDPQYNPNLSMNHGRHRGDDYQAVPDSQYGYMQFVPYQPVIDSQAHASASYTANWVSSTSSIPPEMRDEPETDNIAHYEAQRPSSQMNGENWTERDEHFSPSLSFGYSYCVQPPPQAQDQQDTAEPPLLDVEKEKTQTSSVPTSSEPAPEKTRQRSNKLREQNGEKPHQESKTNSSGGKTTSTKGGGKSDRSDEKRELTFDQRLEKARWQKDRVENEDGTNVSSSSSQQPAQSSATSSAPSATTPVPPAQHAPKASPRQEGHNNQGNSNYNNSRGRNTHQNGSNSQNAAGGSTTQQVPPQNQNAPRYGVSGGDQRDRYPRRDNHYQQQNRYENNQHTYSQRPNQNQNHNQYQPHPNPPPVQPVPVPNQPPQNNYQGNRQYRGGRSYQPNNRNYNGNGQFYGNFNRNPYVIHPQFMDPQMLATINALQNMNIPPGARSYSLLPGPFGMPRPPPLQQEEKFRNTWLDINNVPLPISAYYTMEAPRVNRGGYKNGRGRGGYNYAYNNRTGYRGGPPGQGTSGTNGNGAPITSSSTVKKPEMKKEDEKVEEVEKSDVENAPQDEKTSNVEKVDDVKQEIEIKTDVEVKDNETTPEITTASEKQTEKTEETKTEEVKIPVEENKVDGKMEENHE